MKRVAIVTGASRGIGEATAHALARDGLTVALADLNVVGAQRVAETLPGDGHRAFHVDVVDERSVEELYDAVESKIGVVAVLACVAGGPFLTPGRRPSIVETTTESLASPFRQPTWSASVIGSARPSFWSMAVEIKSVLGRISPPYPSRTFAAPGSDGLQPKLCWPGAVRLTRKLA
jgi:NAD(P)-dependent dehydrogenase (short-subunit alcohol dehydrogenase family)